MEEMVSIATGNFIKTIYKFQQFGIHDTRTGSVARELGISHAAATDMARKLALKELVVYEKYRDIRLTPSGKKVALDIIRKHRLWETFLHKVLGLTMHEIHREAELLEHLTSSFLADRISDYLGHPQTDPHGDPIPDEKGRIDSSVHSILLSSATPENTYRIIRLYGAGKDFFDFCHSNHLLIGSLITVVKQYPENGMTEIMANELKILLNESFSSLIHVESSEKP